MYLTVVSRIIMQMTVGTFFAKNETGSIGKVIIKTQLLIETAGYQELREKVTVMDSKWAVLL